MLTWDTQSRREFYAKIRVVLLTEQQGGMISTETPDRGCIGGRRSEPDTRLCFNSVTHRLYDLDHGDENLLRMLVLILHVVQSHDAVFNTVSSANSAESSDNGTASQQA